MPGNAGKLAALNSGGSLSKRAAIFMNLINRHDEFVRETNQSQAGWVNAMMI